MKTSDMFKELCNKKNINVSELARRIGQTPQNFGKKLKRDTVTRKRWLISWVLPLSNHLSSRMENRKKQVTNRR